MQEATRLTSARTTPKLRSIARFQDPRLSYRIQQASHTSIWISEDFNRFGVHFTPHASAVDKCYQIHYVLNSFNAAARNCWYVPRDVTFDEGSVGCRSRYSPVRQYNKDKPQKYRVDFFILAASKGYHILHLDVYQGKNSGNIGISSQLTGLPTTQKAVANACQQLGFARENRGMRHISMDNCYQFPQLAVLLRERFNCYSMGTARQSRKGWPKELFGDKLKKNQEAHVT